MSASSAQNRLAFPQHDRQILMWGSRGQEALSKSVVAIVGLGGTGSVTAQQLIHLGVGKIIAIDDDIVERSNLSRIVGASLSDVGRTPKVEIVRRTAHAVDASVAVEAHRSKIQVEVVARRLLGCDVIFGCTDGHYSRAILNHIAVQYQIPLIDVGFAIHVGPGYKIASAIGEVRLVLPGGYCLVCSGTIDPEALQAEKADPTVRERFPEYFSGVRVPDPSVIMLNSVVASLGVNIALSILLSTDTPHAGDYYRFNAVKNTVTNLRREPDPSCPVCGAEGIRGLKDAHAWPC